jgi:hypothetical protein
VGKDLTTVVAIEFDDFSHRTANCKRTGDDRAGACSGDKIESLAEVEAFRAARAGKLDDEAVEERGGVDAAHSTAVETQHPVGLHGIRLLTHYNHTHATLVSKLIHDSFG